MPLRCRTPGLWCERRKPQSKRLPVDKQGEDVKPGIRFPIAAAHDGRAVAIRDAESGVSYKCFGCEAPMTAKRGQQRAWHFAHKPPTSGCADPDRALHETAKTLIVQSLTDAQANGTEYRVGFACRVCETALSWNIARPDTTIAVERSVIVGTRSDIVIGRATRGPLIVEVVVTYDIEEPTRARYEGSDIPVFIIRPDWDTVAELATAVNADNLINVSAVRCRECQDALDRALEERSAARTWAVSMLSGLRSAPPDPAGSATPQMRPWQRDKFGREMYQRVRQEVHRNAAILHEMGFVQSKGKPWLFRFQLPEGCGVVFANFGSTEEVPLWDDPSALIHWNLHKRSDEETEALVKQLLRRCRSAGAALRVSFYNQHLDD